MDGAIGPQDDGYCLDLALWRATCLRAELRRGGQPTAWLDHHVVDAGLNGECHCHRTDCHRRLYGFSAIQLEWHHESARTGTHLGAPTEALRRVADLFEVRLPDGEEQRAESTEESHNPAKWGGI